MDVVDHVALAVDPPSEGSSEALVSRAVEPDDGIDATRDQGLWWRRLLCWLDEELGRLALDLPLCWLQVSGHHVT